MGLGAGDPEGHGFERKYLSCDEQGSFRGLYGPDGGGEVALPESAPIGFDPPGTGSGTSIRDCSPTRRESTATRCGSGRSPGDSWKIWCSRG